jgi:TolB protein
MQRFRTPALVAALLALAACRDDVSTGPRAPAAPARAVGGTRPPSCSPNCGTTQRIVFSAGPNFWGDIYTVAPDGTGLVQVTSGPDDDRSPSWSPDYGKIVFGRRSAYGQPVSLWVVNADGSGLHQLFADGPNTNDDEPTWSPDGSRILFTRWWIDAKNATHRELFTVNANGGGLKQVTTWGQNADSYVSEPDYAPDGSKIVYVRSSFATGDHVYVANENGSGATALTSGTGGNVNPAWSPDGTRIAYEQYTPGKTYSSQIMAMNANGSGKTAITSNTFDAEDPSWSRDGTKLVFTTMQPLDATHDASHLYVVDATGLGLTLLGGLPNVQYFANWAR